MVAVIRRLFSTVSLSRAQSNVRAGMQLDGLITRYQWLVVAAIISTLGFVPSTIVKFESLGIVHGLHAVFALGWLSILICQLTFLKLGKYRNHQYLGWMSVPVFAGMVISAGYLLWLTAVPAFAQGTVFRMVYWVDFVLLPVAVFFYLLGLRNIKNTPFHAGYMCMTSVVLIPPGLGRLVYVVILYPLGLPLPWFYELMVMVTLGLVAAVGFAERWKLPAARWAFCALAAAFFSAYWAESNLGLEALVNEYFYHGLSPIHE